MKNIWTQNVQVVNTVKSYESNKPNINSTIKAAANAAGKLKHSNENSDRKGEGIQHIKANLGESLQKWKNKVQ